MERSAPLDELRVTPNSKTEDSLQQRTQQLERIATASLSAPWRTTGRAALTLLAATLPTAASLASGLASLLTGLPTLAALLPSGATAFPDLGRSDLLGSALLATARGTVAAVTGALGALASFFPALAVWAARLVAALSIKASHLTLFSRFPTLAVFTLASGPVALPIARATVRDATPAVTVRICPKRVVVFSIRNAIPVTVGILIVRNSITVHVVVL